MKIGDKIIDFDLKGVDGKQHTVAQYSDKDILVVLFTCNHCPYVLAYEDRLIAIQKDYAAKGVQIVAVNANDEVNYPEDNFNKMIERSKSKQFNFPYLRDQDQSMATAYDAACTPEAFLFDKNRVLQYHGKIDDNWKDPKGVNVTYLRNAIDSLLSGKPVAKHEEPAIGCSIKWTK